MGTKSHRDPHVEGTHDGHLGRALEDGQGGRHREQCDRDNREEETEPHDRCKDHPASADLATGDATRDGDRQEAAQHVET